MLTVLVGSDSGKRAARLKALTKGVGVESYTDVSFRADAMRELAASSSLFGGTLTVVVTGLGDVLDKRDELEKILPDLIASPHTFYISENSLPAPFLKKAKTVETFELKEKIKKAEVFNAFLLTDAFSARTRSQAWALYRKAITLGVEPRELHGKIFWVVKSMLVARDAKSPSESGLNPFVHQKAKAGAAHFNIEELHLMMRELTVLFHEALASGLDMESGLESFILRSLAR